MVAMRGSKGKKEDKEGDWKEEDKLEKKELEWTTKMKENEDTRKNANRNKEREMKAKPKKEKEQERKFDKWSRRRRRRATGPDGAVGRGAAGSCPWQLAVTKEAE